MLDDAIRVELMSSGSTIRLILSRILQFASDKCITRSSLAACPCSKSSVIISLVKLERMGLITSRALPFHGKKSTVFQYQLVESKRQDCLDFFADTRALVKNEMEASEFSRDLYRSIGSSMARVGFIVMMSSQRLDQPYNFWVSMRPPFQISSEYKPQSYTWGVKKRHLAQVHLSLVPQESEKELIVEITLQLVDCPKASAVHPRAWIVNALDLCLLLRSRGPLGITGARIGDIRVLIHNLNSGVQRTLLGLGAQLDHNVASVTFPREKSVMSNKFEVATDEHGARISEQDLHFFAKHYSGFLVDELTGNWTHTSRWMAVYDAGGWVLPQTFESEAEVRTAFDKFQGEFNADLANAMPPLGHPTVLDIKVTDDPSRPLTYNDDTEAFDGIFLMTGLTMLRNDMSGYAVLAGQAFLMEPFSKERLQELDKAKTIADRTPTPMHYPGIPTVQFREALQKLREANPVSDSGVKV